MAARPPGYPTPNMQPQARYAPAPSPMNRYQQAGYPGPQGPPRPSYPGQMGGQMQIGGQMPQMGHGPRMGMPGTPGMHPHQGGMQTHGGMHPHFSPASTTPGTPSIGNKSPHIPSPVTSYNRPGMPPPGMPSQMESRKRPPDPRSAQQLKNKKKKKMADKILPQRVRDLVPESQAYMDLLAFERKLDATIMRKRLDIQEALKRPMKVKKKLRVFISNTFFPAKHEPEDGEETMASWELRVEGRLLDELNQNEANLPPSELIRNAKTNDPNKLKRKFSSFFKSLVIELDKDLYGPDNHLVEWHRTPTTQETDGFQVKRPGDTNVKCTILLMLDYSPMQFKLEPRLARLLGIHTQTRPVIINALWQYIKQHKLQDASEREYINCDKYLQQIFEVKRMKFSEIPQRLHSLLMPPDPIVINHTITSKEGPDGKKTACYDIDVEVDDNLKQQMNNFLLSTQSQQEIAALDNKIHETVETITQLKTSRDFLLGFSKDPQEFINNWLVSQTRDLKTMTDVVGNPEEERRADYYHEPWAQEAVFRYFYGKVQQRRAELEQALAIRNT